MPKGVYKHLKHKPDCQCCCCKNKRGECKGKNSYWYGKNRILPKHTNPNCQCCICKAARGEWIISEETIRKISESLSGIPKSEETKKKMRENHKGRTGYHCTKETGRKISEANTGKIRTDEQKKKYSESKLGLLNPMKRPDVIRKHIKACGMKPNKKEIYLKQILNKFFPGEFQINTNASVMVIGSKVPDFINFKKHKIIELFGDYWHSKEITGRTKLKEERQRINHFSKYGYQTLIVWEYELNDIEKLIKKIEDFSYV